ncbi:Pyridoxal reductase [Sphaceloma murrayae]|uniref:Pyridoxal reductase n=1 Tax=Sphaceloma murrayae TaxID=2082308 RepID=A0A2K1R2N2_9PEZI|nr:Pyridoxal reductase [Sphaceloma murrayae]
MAQELKFLLGGSHIYLWSDEDTANYVNVLKKHNVVDIDTSIIYDGSEKTIGSLPDRNLLRVHTKTGGFIQGILCEESILDAAATSLKSIHSIDTYMLQSPDPATPIRESLAAIGKLYKEGAFKTFGLSNFSASQVQEVYDICKSEGYPLPTVYTGPYNAVTRRNEEDLFPVLRRLGLSFWAYSPVGAGFLTKRFEDFNLPGDEGFGKGRFSREAGWAASIVNQLYNRPKLLEGLKLWNKVAISEGIAPAELAIRWIANHSVLKPELGDGIIFGSSSPQQLDQTLVNAKKGPLSKSAVEQIEQMWNVAKEDAQTGKPLFA